MVCLSGSHEKDGEEKQLDDIKYNANEDMVEITVKGNDAVAASERAVDPVIDTDDAGGVAGKPSPNPRFITVKKPNGNITVQMRNKSITDNVLVDHSKFLLKSAAVNNAIAASGAAAAAGDEHKAGESSSRPVTPMPASRAATPFPSSRPVTPFQATAIVAVVGSRPATPHPAASSNTRPSTPRPSTPAPVVVAATSSSRPATPRPPTRPVTPAPLSPLANGSQTFAVQINDARDDENKVQEDPNDSNNVEVIPPVENPTYETLRYDRELVQEAAVCSLADVASHVANEQQQEIAIVEEVVALEEAEAVEVVAAVVEEEEEDSIYGELNAHGVNATQEQTTLQQNGGDESELAVEATDANSTTSDENASNVNDNAADEPVDAERKSQSQSSSKRASVELLSDVIDQIEKQLADETNQDQHDHNNNSNNN